MIREIQNSAFWKKTESNSKGPTVNIGILYLCIPHPTQGAPVLHESVGASSTSQTPSPPFSSGASSHSLYSTHSIFLPSLVNLHILPILLPFSLFSLSNLFLFIRRIETRVCSDPERWSFCTQRSCPCWFVFSAFVRYSFCDTARGTAAKVPFVKSDLSEPMLLYSDVSVSETSKSSGLTNIRNKTFITRT
jgi:hypothetical protein